MSKTALGERLTDEGIEYEHLPALGNPRNNREGFSELEGMEAREARERFSELLNKSAAHAALNRVLELADAGAVALLCFERDENRCHRELVLAALRSRVVTA